MLTLTGVNDRRSRFYAMFGNYLDATCRHGDSYVWAQANAWCCCSCLSIFSRSVAQIHRSLAGPFSVPVAVCGGRMGCRGRSWDVASQGETACVCVWMLCSAIALPRPGVRCVCLLKKNGPCGLTCVLYLLLSRLLRWKAPLVMVMT